MDCTVPVPILSMKRADLEFITSSAARGALGSTGTGSGRHCDGTTVHCCFRDIIRVAEVAKESGYSGYALVTPTCVYDIEIVPEDSV